MESHNLLYNLKWMDHMWFFAICLRKMFTCQYVDNSGTSFSSLNYLRSLLIVSCAPFSSFILGYVFEHFIPLPRFSLGLFHIAIHLSCSSLGSHVIASQDEGWGRSDEILIYCSADLYRVVLFFRWELKNLHLVPVVPTQFYSVPRALHCLWYACMVELPSLPLHLE